MGITGVHTLINRDVWDNLSQDTRKIISDVEAEMPEIWAQIQAEDEAVWRPQLEDMGIQIVTPPAEVVDQLYEIAAPIVYRDFVDRLNAQGLPGQELWDWLIETRDKYREEKGLPPIPSA
jgi:TRAP-type C4-dicarboxylate transport system substrate-binding protein